MESSMQRCAGVNREVVLPQPAEVPFDRRLQRVFGGLCRWHSRSFETASSLHPVSSDRAPVVLVPGESGLNTGSTSTEMGCHQDNNDHSVVLVPHGRVFLLLLVLSASAWLEAVVRQG